MDIAFCYESVLPQRGGCETYIASLAHRLVADGHTVHLYASRWDASALPDSVVYHSVQARSWPRFLRPWSFGGAVLKALEGHRHDATIGFDKTWGLDILYPQGGLYAASADHNILKEAPGPRRAFMRMVKRFDPAHQSFMALERRQYLGDKNALVIAISEMVRGHFRKYYDIQPENLRVVRIATNPDRFVENDRPLRRDRVRTEHGIRPDEIVGLFCGMNYKLKGLPCLLAAMRHLPAGNRFRLLAVGADNYKAMEKLARHYGVRDRVVFAGYRKDMRDGYFAADMFIHPTFYDPCSHVVPEAMSCGLPVITTRHNGAAELMNPPREGVVIDDPHNHRALARAIEKFFDPRERQRCGQAGRQAASRWTFDQHYRQMFDVFSEAARRRNAA
jgi:UDP-glucose:(heptosyl)LPS alpha-1,3-glucosyltransferase